MEGIMKNIITIQHTQSIHHTNGMIGSWTDWDLTDKGIKQAEITGKYIGIKPILTDLLRESNLGAAVGKSAIH